MNSYVLVIRMLYQLATHEAAVSFENGIVKGDYTDILDHCDNLSTTLSFYNDSEMSILLTL